MQTRLPFFSLIRASGDDRELFLHSQLSNDITNLAPQQACYATYNTPKGRVIANMLVLNRGEDFLLLVAADLTETVIKRLRMFVLRAKAVFEHLPELGVSCKLPEGTPPKTAKSPSLNFYAETQNNAWKIVLPHQGCITIGTVNTLPAYHADAENTWNTHEILSGYPWISAPTSETCVAQMLNQHIIGGIHFKKGCYPGQEIIARAQYRGQVKRGLAILTSPSCQTAGTVVYQDNQEAGIIINSAISEAGSTSLAVIKFSAAQATLSNNANNTLKPHTFFFQPNQK